LRYKVCNEVYEVEYWNSSGANGQEGSALCNKVGIERHWSIKENDNINNSDPIGYVEALFFVLFIC
jgi:hypothetical protein